MKRVFVLILGLILMTGCGGSKKAEAEQVIHDAFKARAEVVFLYKDKKPLEEYFTPEALQQIREFLDWSPNGQWENVKNLKYSYKIRMRELKVDGKQASAEVYETAVVTWEYIDPSRVVGTAFIKEDAWSNRRHLVSLTQEPDGNWKVSRDIVRN
ncbi:MAG: hypothetical protein CVU89_11325 [Firmicutes bacterium HGW-Firmicutes-14]|jgi:hypothetical protein|nr:MAG: hypothetical protein CVU89_11325 [Firmicutes bacterium HGW-Firmicutes-14]